MIDTKNLQTWSKRVVQEIVRHATEDNCPHCKELVAQLMSVKGVKVEELTGAKSD